jgi:membrane-bound lytic murein transglycosylase B
VGSVKVAVLVGTGVTFSAIALAALALQSGVGGGTQSFVSPLTADDSGTAPSGALPAVVERGEGRPNVDPGWVRRTAKATDVPAPALSAYGSAVLAAPRGCDIGWTTLAGIGWVESQHGTIDDRVLGDDGRPSEPILGPALDGQQFAAIRATPQSTAMHGNPIWDHAVGPLQFIPSTWQRWQRDGDGDGVKDPHDIDDAAAAAVAYLCHDGHDLTTSKGWNAAVFSYNHDNAYVVAVHAAANRYGRATG